MADTGGAKRPPACLLTRRSLLLAGGLGSAVILVNLPGGAVAARLATYPRRRVARLSDLLEKVPVDFRYPDDEEYSESMLVRLGTPAGGGIGPGRDVVAFSTTCTHQGGPLYGTFQPDDSALGPCPLHLTTYDLTRHGMVISGQAYQSLPQVVLELEGDHIHATGVLGLLYGRADNLQAGAP